MVSPRAASRPCSTVMRGSPIGASMPGAGTRFKVDPMITREYFRIIDDQADRMIGLIADLLDAGRIETGTLSVSPEPSEVGALVDPARNAFLSGGARHALLIDLPPGLPPVLADRQRIVQVLNNLLANGAPLPGHRSHPDRCGTRRGACRGLGCRRGKGHRAGAPRARSSANTSPPGTATARSAALHPGTCTSAGAWSRLTAARIRMPKRRSCGLGARFTFTLPVAQTASWRRPSRAAPAGPARDRRSAPILQWSDRPGSGDAVRQVRDTLDGRASVSPVWSAGDHREPFVAHPLQSL